MNKGETIIADRYRILKALGEGGMADVYLAEDTILNRQVAIKILRGELSKDPLTLLRFQREASAVSKLHHPNVVEVYDIGEYHSRSYIVMEYVHGRTLKQLIAQRGPLGVYEAVNIMIQLTQAIEHAHQNDLIHRDIKPQNVLVKDDGTIKITDFGIALSSDAIQLTQVDSVLGSAHYIAPETTRGEEATVLIDIYALGIVFYELLVGKVPYNGDNAVQIAMKHVKEDLPSVRKFNPTIPQSVENVIIKATAKNCANRYQSATEMLNDLKVCLNAEHMNDAKIVFNTVETVANETKYFDPKDLNKQTSKQENEESKKEPKKRSSRLKKLLLQALIIIILVIASIIGIYYSGIIPGFSPVKYVDIPDLSGKNKVQAEKILENAGLSLDSDIKEKITDDSPVGSVISQKPGFGGKAKEGSKVRITISSGNYFVVGNYVWQSIYNVEEQLKDEGIIVEKEYQPRSDLEEGIILQQEYLKPGDKVSPNDTKTIKFIVSVHPNFVMSNYVGAKVDVAKKTLEQSGAKVQLSELPTTDMKDEEKEKLKKGVVIKQSVEPGVYYEQAPNKSIILYYYK